MACDYVQGELNGPQTMYFDEHIDYFFWALSSESEWVPDHARETFIRGMGEWGVWVPHRVHRGARDSYEALLGALLRQREGRGPVSRDEVLPLLIPVAEGSRVAVGLPESAEELARRLLATGAVEMYGLDRQAKRNYDPDTSSI